MGYCEVIVDIAHEKLDRVFTYRVPTGMCLVPGMRVQIPFGPRKIEGYVIRLTDTASVADTRIKDVTRPLEDYPVLLPHMMELAIRMAKENHCPLCETIRLMLPAQMRGDRIRKKTKDVVYLTIDRQIAPQIIASQIRAPKRKLILETLLEPGKMDMAALRSSVGSCRDAVLTLEKMGFVRIAPEESLRQPYGNMPSQMDVDPTLTDDQFNILQVINPALETREGRFLLYGVTGSGKTEVYIRAVRKTLELGAAAIVLVPEIALTPQMVDWFRGRFGDMAAVLHSRLSAGQRFDEWRRIRRGDARVVIGARSAIFAPLENLGLVIVDEEHEQSYLADHSPRYDAREIAKLRCDIEGATLILASATPSMRSFALANRGDLSLLELPTRVKGRQMPEVHLVDMRKELEDGNHSIFSAPMLQGLKRCLDSGKQAILFINRRGYSTFVSCRSCGYVVKCPNCDVSLTYHQEGDQMSCHYCGYYAAPPKTCPECKSPYIRYFGSGTQKVEAETKKYFPNVPILRMDNDTTKTKDSHYQILSSFRQGRARILIGTQMIAKGLDFPNVTMVGVVAADGMLGLPDYRSAERTFQLITQVAGRAGRADDPGTVFVQTYSPDHYSIQTASKQDYRAFFEIEMKRRRQQLFPPFTMICRLLVEGDNEKSVKETSASLTRQMSIFFEQHTGAAKMLIDLRDMDPTFTLLRGKHRRQVLIKLIDRIEAQETVEKITQLANADWIDVKVFAEINPSNMM